MKPILSILLAGSFAAPALFAAEPSRAAVAAAGSTPAPYELKKHSSFEIAPGARPPFWPIGWVKRERGATAAVSAAPKFVLDAKNFTVTSILLGPPPIAVVNGRAYEEGQIVRMARPAAVGTAAGASSGSGPAAAGPRVRVQRIADGEVWLQCDRQLVNVTLKRAELGERKIHEELLSSDRDEDAPLPGVSSR